jgi:hypothetical protein
MFICPEPVLANSRERLFRLINQADKERWSVFRAPTPAPGPGATAGSDAAATPPHRPLPTRQRHPAEKTKPDTCSYLFCFVLFFQFSYGDTIDDAICQDELGTSTKKECWKQKSLPPLLFFRTGTAGSQSPSSACPHPCP